MNANNIMFDSRNPACKKPFGAVTEGSEIEFTIAAGRGEVKTVRLIVEKQIIVGNQDEVTYTDQKVYPMRLLTDFVQDTQDHWQTKVSFAEKNVYAYYFELSDGEETVYYGNNGHIAGHQYGKVVGTGGHGQIYEDTAQLVRYRQTVYDAEFQTPDWAKDGVYYYIFPERFKNGDKTNDPQPGVRKYLGTKEIEFHSNWLEEPYYPGKSGDSEYNNDFFGGDLRGIREKLGYLKDLGINIIYMTPIFESSSNHKYDTADYKKIDPGFGTNEEFQQLVDEAKELGIRVIIDVSLNHSGADSIYMNRYGTYPGIGAFQNEKVRKDSPYYDWYDFIEDAGSPDGSYKQWLSVPTLPKLKESDGYKNFAYRDADSVTKFWLKKGTGGWRMDVSPWLSDTFWREWRVEVKKTNPDALTVAEVWFDSSKYFLGDMFDSTMNYIFREAVFKFANGGDAAVSLGDLEMTRENYPPEAFYSLMNLLSTHDATRALYEFGYKNAAALEAVRKIAIQRLILSVFMQMTYPGAPAVYYGDEVGVTGGDDPFNRATYPWEEDGGKPDMELHRIVRELISMRRENPILRRGSLEPVYHDRHAIVWLRRLGDQAVLVAWNNADRVRRIDIDGSAFNLPLTFTDLQKTGEELCISGGRITLEVPAIGGRAFISK